MSAEARATSTESLRRRDRRRGERAEDARLLAPLLVGVFVAAHAAVAAVTVTTDAPVYEFAVHAGVTVAVLASFIAVRTGANLSFLGGAVMLLAFTGYALRFELGLPGVEVLYPTEVVGDEEPGLATLMTWFLVGFCFMQSQRQNLVFIFVPGLSIFGLMATRNLNPVMLGAFMVFLLASIFCWGYEHFLSIAERAGKLARLWPWVQAHISGAVLLFAVAALGAGVLGNALYYTTPRMYTGFGLQQRILNYTGAHVQGYFLFRNGFDVGGGPIRLSHEPVLKVWADAPSLLRGRAYDYYNGRGWRRSTRESGRAVDLGERTFDVRRVQPRPEPMAAPVGVPVPTFPLPPEVMRERDAAGYAPPVGQPSGAEEAAGPGPAPRAQVPQGGPAAGAPLPPDESGHPPSPPGLGSPSPPPTGLLGPGGLPGGREEDEDAPSVPDWDLAPLRGREFMIEAEILGNATGAVFVPPFAATLRIVPGGGVLGRVQTARIAVDHFGSIESVSQMQPGQRYEAWSRVPDFPEETLRRASFDDLPEILKDQYVEQIGIEPATQLGPLVAQITAGLDNGYDKAIALQRYLERECLYTLDAPPTPPGQDAVVYFVTESRRGACDLFSSALSVMCRLAGLPARVATGFNHGTYEPDQGAFIVRGTEAHAWSEVYFPRVGWVVFDPVAERSLEREGLLSLLRSGHWRVALSRTTRQVLVIVGILLGLYLVLSALIDPRRLLGRLARRIGWRMSSIDLAALEMQELLRLVCRLSGRRYRLGMTPAEAVATLSQVPGFDGDATLRAELGATVEDFYALRYSRRRTAGQVSSSRRRMGALSRDLRQALRRARRMRRSDAAAGATAAAGQGEAGG